MTDKDPAREAAEKIYSHVTDALLRRELLMHDDLEEIIRSAFAEALETLARHEQQGGITMKCGHPVQCAYPDEGGGCVMCDDRKEISDLRAAIDAAREGGDE